jgi:predicted Zn-dependent peptidase
MMFKGTRMLGTENYEEEIPYIQKTDSLGELTIELRKEIGEWRFEIFEDFGRDIVENFTIEETNSVGNEKYKQSSLVVEKIRSMDAMPDSLAETRYLLEEDGVDYLEKYLHYKTAWSEVRRLIAEQREKYIVNNELWELYQNNGANFLNAGTSYDFTVYFVYLPSNRLKLWMVAESDRMDSPVFREFWVERDVVMEERRLGENDPDAVLGESFYAAAFKACPYQWPVVGWMSDLRTIDRTEVADYHRIYYAPNNATAVLVGDVNLAEAKEMAEKYFAPIPAQPEPPDVETREPEQQGERRITVEHSANPKLMIGYHKPTYPDPEDLAFNVMISILGDGKTSRLYKSIYEEQELTASPPDVYAGPSNRYDNLLVIAAEPRHPHTLEEVEEAIYKELEKLKEEPVSEREIQRVKNQLEANYVRQLGSNLGLAFTTMMGELYYGDYMEIIRMQEKIKRVTPEDIMEAAERYLIQKNRVVAHRIQVKEEAEEGGKSEQELMARRQQQLMQYIQSLPEQERNEIIRKFRSMHSQEEMMEFGRELYERAVSEGFIKEDEKEKGDQ